MTGTGMAGKCPMDHGYSYTNRLLRKLPLPDNYIKEREFGSGGRSPIVGRNPAQKPN